MQEISNLKVENPSCIWGRLMGVRGLSNEYHSLLTEMNLFYHDVTQDLRSLMPATLEEGQLCVVLWAKSWCRAVVESVVIDSVAHQALCFLVDHGERLIVPVEQIRVAVQNFLQLPFWMRRFHLSGIKPTTLRVSVFEEQAKLIPSSHWDSSATLYLHNLLQVSTQAEAVLLESESKLESTSIELYLTIRNIKICVNDDLVAKKFAYYIQESVDSDPLDEADQCPIMLSPNILLQTPQSNPVSVMSQGLKEDGRGDWSVARPYQEHDWKTFAGDNRPEVINGDHCPCNPSDPTKDELDNDTAADTAAAAESDSSEETDSSLAKEISLFRFLKFMNSSSSSEQVAPSLQKPQHDQLKDCKPKEVVGSTFSVLEDKSLDSNHLEHQEDEEKRRPDNFGPAEMKENLRSSEEDWACSRLLEWLNPEPLNPDPDTVPEKMVIPSNPSKCGILVHSSLPLQPCTSLDDAPITDNLRRVCRRMLCAVLSPTDCHSWPAVARGYNTIVISRSADQPLGYLAPLLSHIHLNSIFTSHTSSTGPIVVLLCPGWEKAQAVYDLLEESKVAQVLHPVIVLLGIGKDEAKAVRIPKNCLLLVTTPFSLERLLSCHCFLFLRLYHLVLDEADQLFAAAPDQMSSILQHFQKVTLSKENASSPQQLVAVAKRWTSHMEGLIANHMPYPCIVMTAPEEAALYGDVQQIVLMCLESNKISVLLGALDFNPEVGQKTLIIANSAKEVEDIFKAVSNKSAFCLQTHEGLTHQFDLVVQQWGKGIGSGTHVILVTTNECLHCLGIRDATCVVHFSFPRSPKLYGSRLFCMAENFRNLSEREQMKSHNIRSLLLISESNARHIIGLLRYLRRTNASLPTELLSFAEGVHMAREDMKTDRPLCRYLKSFGACRDKGVCPDRHRIFSHLDHSDLPASGLIEVVPLHIKTASIFYGRIVREATGFDTMAAKMALYYADKKPGADEVMAGSMYAVQDDDGFHRVQVLSVPDRGDRLFFSVFVRFIDVGKEEEVKCHQILLLPEEFQSLPGQAVEIVICRVKPVNSENEWHPKVTRTVSQKIQGLQHRARAVLSLGDTVFVDLMVRVTEVPGLKTVINEYNVQSLILNTGMGTANLEHVDLLRALCQESVAVLRGDGPHVNGSEGSEADLGVRIKAEEEVFAEAFREAEVNKLSLQEPPCFSTHDPVLPIAAVNQLQPEGQKKQRPVVPPVDTEGNTQTSGLSLHPQVRWHQTSDSVTVTVKLVNPECQRCDFYTDRVVYSGSVDGKRYAANLELQAHIAVERCRWEIKSNEPVLKLVKQQQRCWERLVKNKNIFVAYDMEHLEDEVGAENGQCFMEKTGEDGWYVHSESGSESD